LDDLIREGKVLYIGCSNLPSWQVVESQWTSRELGIHAFASCQDEYSLLVRGIEKELLPAMQAHGLGLLPYFPLASGMLTGKYKRNTPLPEGSRFAAWKALGDRYANEANFDTVERLEKFAHQRGHSLLELAFSWLAANPSVSSVIAGATRPEQVEQNAKAVDWVLTPEDLTEVDNPAKQAARA